MEKNGVMRVGKVGIFNAEAKTRSTQRRLKIIGNTRPTVFDAYLSEVDYDSKP